MTARNEKRKEQYKKLFSVAPKFLFKDCIQCNKKDMAHRKAEVSSGGTVQYRAICTDCWKKKEQYYRIKNWATIKKRKVLRAKIAKKKCIEYLGGKCKKCGYNKSMRALTFHHTNRSNKLYEVAVIKDHSWNKVKQELDKCILICFNCHMEEEELRDAN